MRHFGMLTLSPLLTTTEVPGSALPKLACQIAQAATEQTNCKFPEERVFLECWSKVGRWFFLAVKAGLMSTGRMGAGRVARCHPSHPNIHSKLTAGLEVATRSGRCSSVALWSLSLLSCVFLGKTLISTFNTYAFASCSHVLFWVFFTEGQQ